jgi:hypothetical protein
MQTILVWKRLLVFLVGLLVFFIGERYLAAEAYFAILRYGALALCAIGLALTFVLSVLASGKGLAGEAKAWRYSALWQLGVLVALGLYLGYRASLGDAAAPETLTHKALLAAWLIVLALSLAAGAGLEWARRESGHGRFAEPQRVGRSGLAWLLIGMLFAILTAVNYVAAQKDVTRDWSYLKVTSPSPSTLATLKSLTSDVEIAVFYPGGNDVLTYVKQYFDQVSKAEPRVKLSYYDKDMHPTKAEEFRVSRNGQIVFDVGGKRSRIDTGTTLAKARKTLRNLDQEFQKAFLEITADKKTVYFTRGHGEASWVGDGADDPLKSLGLLEGFLRQQNFTLKLFGIGEGSASAVPDDAAAVVVAGATQAFQKEEVEALKAYVEKGGNLMVFFDLAKGTGEAAAVAPVGNDPLREFVQSAGIRFNEVPLGNDKNYVAATRSAADNWFIFSNIFTSHESVASLARHDERIAVLVFQGGYLSVTPQTGSWKAVETVRALSDTYADTNKNFKIDQGEKRDSYVLGAVAEPKSAKVDAKAKKPGGRIVAFADATVLSDALVRNPGNVVFFADSLKWLVGDVERTGEVASEEDVKIRHTRKEDVIWFHGTVAVVPLLVLGAGYFATRRKRGANGSGGGGAATTQEKSDAA